MTTASLGTAARRGRLACVRPLLEDGYPFTPIAGNHRVTVVLMAEPTFGAKRWALDLNQGGMAGRAVPIVAVEDVGWPVREMV